MGRFGYHCSHEQFPPRRLLELAVRAEQAGFAGGMCSDHFHPWSERQEESGFAWAWLGAALQATSLPFGVVTAPGGWRYHPAIIAQASATLAAMFPGRFWLAVGSGEHLNEHVVGRRWPAKPERNALLAEAVEIIRALWAGEAVTRDGGIRTEAARLATRPEQHPLLLGAALSAATAAWAGGWADGLITVAQERETMAELVDAFRSGGGEGKPLYLQTQLSFARTDADAARAAHDQWRFAVLPSSVLAELRTPREFDDAVKHVREEDVAGAVRVSADPEQHLDWLRGDLELGFTAVYLHNVHPDQERFIDVFGERVLPVLSGVAAGARE